MQTADIFIDYPYELFSFMREMRKPVFHNSNVFLRDVQYAIQEYFEYRDGVTIKNFEAESLARDVTRELERKGVLKRVNPQGFIVNFPDLVTGKDGTKGALLGGVPELVMPPAASPPAAASATPKPAVAPAATKPAPPAAATPAPPAAATPAAAGAAPAGAKAPPPWLKK
jgi:hypothetical protein